MSKSPKKSKSLTRAGNRPATISAQQTIPYVRMLPDGICQLPGGVYTKTLEYEDINYSVASAEDQTAIFSGWSAWLNYFDSSLPFQLSFVNRRSRSGSRYKVNISEADDRFNSVRTEYTGMLKNQIAKSNNGIERAKYVTFCIPAENVAAARPRLERVEADVIGNFKRLGVQSQPLDGRERLALLHGQLHPGSREPFRFKWADIAHTGMGTKDFTGSSFGQRQGANMSRELTRLEKAAIRKLVTKWCANYDKDYGCLPLDCPCYMLGKCWTGAYCRYFRSAVLPLDPVLERSLTVEAVAETRPCPVCGRAFLPDGRQRYCSPACAGAARRQKQRGYMRKYRGRP